MRRSVQMWLAGTLSSGQVKTIAFHVVKRVADRFRDDEAALLVIIAPLDRPVVPDV